jgi:hypothetical protein
MKITKDVVYAVRSKVTGKFAGSSGYRVEFCDDVKRAKFHNKVGPAKAILTRWRNSLEQEKKYPQPDNQSYVKRLEQLELCCAEAEVVKVERYLHVVETVVF